MKSLSRILLVSVCLLSSAVTGQVNEVGPPRGNVATGPLRKHPTNDRYFTDGSGKAIYLTGSHTWANLVDNGLGVEAPLSTTDPPSVFNYDAYLDLLQKDNHNFIRLWRWELPKTFHSKGSIYFSQPHPWMRSGPGTALDGKLKFDLSQFDQSYFDRLRSRVIAARDRGIYVSIMLFEGWHLLGTPTSWQYHPFHGSNNVNDIHGDANGNGEGEETHSLHVAAVLDMQKAYVRKVIDTVNDLDNVLYEIANESAVAGSTQWQYELINFIKSYEAAKPKQHPVGMTSQAWSLAADHSLLWNSPADWVSLSQVTSFDSPEDSYISDPPAAPGGKVSILDTDHLGWEVYADDAALSRAWVWKSFLRGHNPILMEDLKGNSGWIAAHAAMGHTRTYANKMNLVAMTPSLDRASTKYCLANPGQEYLVYQPKTGEFSVNLTAGTYAFEWFNPATGAVASTGSVKAAGGKQTFTPPFAGPAVLYLKVASVVPRQYRDISGEEVSSGSSELPSSVPLFNGIDLSGWVPVNVAPNTFTVRDGMIISTGIPTGVIRTDRMYENFIVELEWRHMKPGGNAGLFLWGDGVPSVGIPFTRGIEVQILDNAYNAKGKNEWFTTHGDIFPIHGAKMKPVGRVASSGDRSFPQEELSKSSPEWNHYRVVANQGELRLSVNGTEVTVGKDCWPRKGYIFLESEGSECHFRNLRIQELPSTNVSTTEMAQSGEGRVPLFTGIDLANWKVPEGDNGHWKVVDEVLDYDAESEAPGDKSLWSQREYRNFQLIVDWRIKETPYTNPNVAQILPDGSEAVDVNGKPIQLSIPDSDSGIFLRGSDQHQVNIWCWPIGSGEMYSVRRNMNLPSEVRSAVTPRVNADKPVGQWNRFEITVRNETVRVLLNNEVVIAEATLPDLPPLGPIGLQHHGYKRDGKWTCPPSLVQFRNIIIKEIP